MMSERKILVKPGPGNRIISHSYPLHNQVNPSLVTCFLFYVGYLDYPMVLWYILMFLRWYLWVPLLQLSLRSLLLKATHKCVLPLQLQTVSCTIDPAINVNDKVAFYLKLIPNVFRIRPKHVFQNTDARVIFLATLTISFFSDIIILYVQQILKITKYQEV